MVRLRQNIVPLKQLIEMQSFSGMSDIDIIEEYFILNGMESEGIELIGKLAKNKCDDLNNELFKVKSNINQFICGSGSFIYRTFNIEIAEKLNHIIAIFIAGYDIEKEFPQNFKWLQETIPTLEKPIIFWRDFDEYLISKGIKFKEKENKKNGKKKKV